MNIFISLGHMHFQLLIFIKNVFILECLSLRKYIGISTMKENSDFFN